MASYKIVIDTREQKPLWDPEKEISKGLNVGDYSIEGYEDKIAIERKSLQDLFGTLGQGHARFKKELERAQSLDYFAIVIEGSYSNCLEKSFDGAYHCKMKGEVITSILFTLHVKYGIRIFFTNHRFESKRLIKEIFNAYVKVQNAKEKAIVSEAL